MPSCRLPKSIRARCGSGANGALPANLDELLLFVGRCFTHKRKTLRNNLRPFYGAEIDDLPEAGLRAEQLTLAQFVELHARLKLNQ